MKIDKLKREGITAASTIILPCGNRINARKRTFDEQEQHLQKHIVHCNVCANFLKDEVKKK